MSSVEELKSLVGKGQGLARSNLFRIILPSVIGGIKLNIVGELLNRGASNLKRDISSQDINMLCSAVNIPGRSLLTHERKIGLVTSKTAYGFQLEDVTLTFRVLNDFKIKEYFEAWQNIAVTTEYELAFFNDYTENVIIQALSNSPSSSYDKLLKLSYAGLGRSGLETAISSTESVTYTCLLENAYPTSVLAMPFSDGNSELLELTVTLSYRDWKRRESNKEDLVDSLRDIVIDNSLDWLKGNWLKGKLGI